MKFTEKNILVIGGAGFVGSNVVDRLIKQGHSVIVLDNFSTGKKENINPCAKLYELSVEDEDLKKVFRREKIDVVYYFASAVNDKESEEEQQEYMKMYIDGFLNLMKNVVDFEVKKVVLGSTLQVYGEENGCLSEEAPVKPETYNGVIHATLENILKVTAKNNGFRYSILRCSSIYGKRQSEIGEGGLIQRYINTLKRGSVPVIIGDENELRDYIFISDVVNASLKVLEIGDNNIYNIASGDAKSIGKVVDTLVKKINPKVKYMVEPGKTQEIFYSNVSVEKAIKELEWRPVCSIELGLEVTYKKYKR